MPVDRPTSPTKPQHLERLLEVSRTLSSTLDLPQLLQTIVDSAAELTQSEAASILLYNSSAGELRFEAASGSRRGPLSAISVPLDSSIAGWVFTHTRPMVVQDASADPRVYRRVDSALSFKTRSILGVPLLIKREAIGVIEAVNKHPTRNYTEDDLAVLETLAAQAAIAIENARLLSKLQEANAELTRLDSMKSISSPSSTSCPAPQADPGSRHLPDGDHPGRLPGADGRHHPQRHAAEDDHRRHVDDLP
jgi:GAF domain-containing protein